MPPSTTQVRLSSNAPAKSVALPKSNAARISQYANAVKSNASLALMRPKNAPEDRARSRKIVTARSLE